MNYNKVSSHQLNLSAEQHLCLEQAYWRYLCFAGLIYLDEQHEQQANTDRLLYPHWCVRDPQGQPTLNMRSLQAFMSAVSGFSQKVCLAWFQVHICRNHDNEHPERTRSEASQ